MVWVLLLGIDQLSCFSALKYTPTVGITDITGLRTQINKIHNNNSNKGEGGRIAKPVSLNFCNSTLCQPLL